MMKKECLLFFGGADLHVVACVFAQGTPCIWNTFPPSHPLSKWYVAHFLRHSSMTLLRGNAQFL